MGDHDFTREELDQTRRQLETRWEALTYHGLHEFERDWIRMFWLKGEVNNGGFHQYFFNSAGDEAMQALDALARLQLPKTHQILCDAIACFGPNGYSPVREERWQRLDLLPETIFDRVTDAYYKSFEDVYRQALVRVRLEYQRLGLKPAESSATSARGSRLV